MDRAKGVEVEAGPEGPHCSCCESRLCCPLSSGNLSSLLRAGGGGHSGERTLASVHSTGGQEEEGRWRKRVLQTDFLGMTSPRALPVSMATGHHSGLTGTSGGGETPAETSPGSPYPALPGEAEGQPACTSRPHGDNLSIAS